MTMTMKIIIVMQRHNDYDHEDNEDIDHNGGDDIDDHGCGD